MAARAMPAALASMRAPVVEVRPAPARASISRSRRARQREAASRCETRGARSSASSARAMPRPAAGDAHQDDGAQAIGVERAGRNRLLQHGRLHGCRASPHKTSKVARRQGHATGDVAATAGRANHRRLRRHLAEIDPERQVLAEDWRGLQIVGLSSGCTGRSRRHCRIGPVKPRFGPTNVMIALRHHGSGKQGTPNHSAGPAALLGRSAWGVEGLTFLSSSCLVDPARIGQPRRR